MKKGAEWIPFYRTLRSGAKRGLPRAARFIYLELSMESRTYGGALPLPRGFKNDVDAVHDILGGSRFEIAKALELLSVSANPSDPSEEPMVTLSGPVGARVLTVTKHRIYVSGDYSTPRVQAMRKEQRPQEQELTDFVFVSGNSDGGGEDKREEEKRREKKRVETPQAPQGGYDAASPIGPEPESGVHVVGAPLAHPPAKSGARRSRTADRGPKPKTAIPDGFAVSPAIEAMCKAEKLPDPHAVLRDFRDKALAKDYRYVDWEAAFRSWMRSEITRRSFPVWAPRPTLPPRAELPPVEIHAGEAEPSDDTADLFEGIGNFGGAAR